MLFVYPDLCRHFNLFDFSTYAYCTSTKLTHDLKKLYEEVLLTNHKSATQAKGLRVHRTQKVIYCICTLCTSTYNALKNHFPPPNVHVVMHSLRCLFELNSNLSAHSPLLCSGFSKERSLDLIRYNKRRNIENVITD